jgi:hypothetical protein
VRSWPTASTPNLEDHTIFGQGFLPLALDKSISNCWAAVLVLVHARYFISLVPPNYGMDTRRKRTSKENMDGRSTSSHDNKEFRTRSMEKQRGMVFGFWKMARSVEKRKGGGRERERENFLNK